MVPQRRTLLAVFVVALGCSQTISYLTGARVVSACGAGLCFTPGAEADADAKVPAGTEAGSLGGETSVFEFTVRGLDATGASFERVLTPEHFALIGGPPGRRISYIHALAAIARGDAAQAERAWCFGFGSAGPMRASLDLPDGARELRVFATSPASGSHEVWDFTPACAP